AVKRYVPEPSSATAAADYVKPIATKVGESVRHWASTGEVTGVPTDIALGAGVSAAVGAVGETVSEAAGAVAGGIESAAGAVAGAFSSAASVLFKRRGGASGAAPAADARAVQGELHAGRPLESGVRGRMERAF